VQPAKGMAVSACTPRTSSTRASDACSAAYRRSVLLPIPAAPDSNRDPDRPRRALSSKSSRTRHRGHALDQPLGPGAAIIGLLIAPLTRRYVDRELRGLKARAEGSA
jgi:hypothetical protein